MDAISPIARRNPVTLCRGVGERIRQWRLQRGWTQEELAERAGIGLSTVKSLEQRGSSTFLRLVRVAVALDLDGDIRALFGPPTRAANLEEVKRRERQRAPRRNHDGIRTAAKPGRKAKTGDTTILASPGKEHDGLDG